MKRKLATLLMVALVGAMALAAFSGGAAAYHDDIEQENEVEIEQEQESTQTNYVGSASSSSFADDGSVATSVTAVEQTNANTQVQAVDDIETENEVDLW